MEEGTLYPALWRLESKGLLSAEWGLSENNRKAKFYRLTTEGRRRLRQEIKTWQAYATAVAKVLAATQLPSPRRPDDNDTILAPLRPLLRSRSCR